MKTRDYARAIRKHRVDPCGGSLLHAHMSSLELDAAVGARSSSPFGGGAGPGGCLRQSSSLGTFRSRFSPPSSPLSRRRAFAGYGRERRSGNNGGDGGLALEERGPHGFGSAPSGERKALLRRELSSMQLAAVTVAGVTNPGGRCRTTSPPTGARTVAIDASMEERLHESSSSRGQGVGRESTRAQQGGGAGNAKVSLQGASTSGGEVGFENDGEGINGSVGSARRRRDDDDEENNAGLVGGWSRSDLKVGATGEPPWTTNERARGRRRGRPTVKGTRGNTRRPEDSRDGDLLAKSTSSCSGPRLRTTPTAEAGAAAAAAAARKKARKPCSRRHPKTPAVKPTPRHLKKPFSSDSLLSCLLDVRFGNTRDLSPAKPPGQKWDLRAMPAGITAGMSAATAGGWDGFDEFDDLAGRVGDGVGMVNPSSMPRAFPASASGHDGSSRQGSDFDVVCPSNECGDSND